MAGNDVVMFCSHIERVPDIHRFLQTKQRSDAGFRGRLKEAVERTGKYRQHIDHLRATATESVTTFEDLVDEAARFVEAFEKTRGAHEVYVPEAERRKNARGGRTGREEWT